MNEDCAASLRRTGDVQGWGQFHPGLYNVGAKLNTKPPTLVPREASSVELCPPKPCWVSPQKSRYVVRGSVTSVFTLSDLPPVSSDFQACRLCVGLNFSICGSSAAPASIGQAQFRFSPECCVSVSSSASSQSAKPKPWEAPSLCPLGADLLTTFPMGTTLVQILMAPYLDHATPTSLFLGLSFPITPSTGLFTSVRASVLPLPSRRFSLPGLAHRRSWCCSGRLSHHRPLPAFPPPAGPTCSSQPAPEHIMPSVLSHCRTSITSSRKPSLEPKCDSGAPLTSCLSTFLVAPVSL